MKKIILIIGVFGFISCTPKNPYYKSHLSDLAYNIFFNGRQEKSNYEISDKSENKNILTYPLPDSLADAFQSGDCVLEIKLDGANKIVNTNVIGMTLVNKKTNTISGFDRYATTNKRINYKIDPKFDKYIQFVKGNVEKLSFRNTGNSTNRSGKAYLKIFFKTQ